MLPEKHVLRLPLEPAKRVTAFEDDVSVGAYVEARLGRVLGAGQAEAEGGDEGAVVVGRAREVAREGLGRRGLAEATGAELEATALVVERGLDERGVYEGGVVGRREHRQQSAGRSGNRLVTLVKSGHHGAASSRKKTATASI